MLKDQCVLDYLPFVSVAYDVEEVKKWSVAY